MEGFPLEWHNMTYRCITREEDMNSGGYLYGDNPLKHSFPVFIALIALAQILSHLIYILLKPLRQPKFVCSLIAGIFLGPTGLGRNKSYLSTMFTMREQILLDTTSNLGLIYFLFLTMVKMDSPLTLRMSKSAWFIGMVSALLPCLANFGIFLASDHLRLTMQGQAPILVSAFVLTHFPNVAHVLKELNLLSSEAGQLALTSAAVNEILVWSSLPIGMVFQTGELRQGYLAALSTIFLIVVCLMTRPILLWIVKRTPEGRHVDDVYVCGILLAALISAFITNSVGLILLGSVIFGLAIPNGPPLATTLVDKSELFINEILMPLFYLYVGFHTDISLVRDWKGTTIVLLLTCLVTLFKLMGAFLPAVIYYNFRVRQAFMLGLLLNVRGVMELIFLRRWKERKVLDQQGYTVMVLANLAITAISVPLLDLLFKQEKGKSLLPVKDSEAIQKTLHSSEFRVVSCVHSEENVHSIITLLEASNPTKSSPICVYVVHLVELVGRTAALVVPYTKHKKMLRSLSSDHIMRAFDNYSRNSNGRVIVNPFTIIAPYKTMDQNIRQLARDHTAQLILVPFRRKNEDDVREVTFLRSLNSHIQASAPCTVGILVDSGFDRRATLNKDFYKVAVVFLGGPDDREALAFATRVSGREGIHVTVFRVLLSHYSAREGEKKLDDSILEDFKIKNMKNEKADYQELVAGDHEQVVNAVKSLELNCDLIILGRRPVDNSMFSDEMLSFTEHPELGVLGDMLASEDHLCGHHTYILVMQHCAFSSIS